MNDTNARPAGESPDRLLRVQKVVDACIERRIGGDALPDEQIIAEHPDLLPELRDELGNLAVIERARRRAASSDVRFGTTVAAGGQSGAEAGPPDFFPGFEILNEIHRGGQGVVYRAIQQATRREVAIKVLLGGAHSGARELVRFEREVQVLGSLRHPNIVTIHDSGIAAGGSFYYVMDYIAGEPLDDYVERRRPGLPNETAKNAAPPDDLPEPLHIEDLLRLFVKICEAVNTAHLHGVIHRDLKPNNIRVDAAGEPHVLDFGLAKIASDDSDPGIEAGRSMTLPGQFVGSLPWASPEQAAGQSQEIDLRCDVYSLGVTMYQMLTGRFPYDMTGTMRDVLDRIQREEPPPPGSVVPQHRGAPFAIDDDVDTIVVKCLDKQPERRYQTAGELARDLQHYLAGRPIEAKRDSGLYVLRKTLGRYKVAVTVAAAFLLVVTSSSVALAILYGRQAQALEREARAHEAERLARREAESINRFLKTTLTAADPYLTNDATLTVKQLLDRAAARIETEFAEQPRLEIELRMTLGDTYRNLGAFDASSVQFEAALALSRREFGPDHVQVAAAMYELADSQGYLAKNERAEALSRGALDIQRRLLGAEHRVVAATLTQLAEIVSDQGRYVEAERTYRTALAMQRKLLTDPHADTAWTLNDLGVLLNRLGKPKESEQILREALEMRRALDPESLAVVKTLSNLAEAIRGQGDLHETARLHREALALRRKRLPPEHPDLAITLTNLGTALDSLGQLDEAERMLREAVALRRKIMGGAHPMLYATISNLAMVLNGKQQYGEAENLLREALDGVLAAHGPDHDDVARARMNLAHLLKRNGDHAGAEEQFRLALDTLRKILGDDHPAVAINLNNLAIMLQSVGRFDEAEPLIREAIDIFAARFGEGHANVAHCVNTLGVILRGKGDLTGAEDAFRRALDRRLELFGEEHRHTAGSLNNLASVLLLRPDFDAAEPLLRTSLRVRRALLSSVDPELAESLHTLGLLLVQRRATGDLDEAEALLRESLDIRKKALRPNHWQTADTKSLLGHCLARLGRHEAAEALLLQVFDPDRSDPTQPAYVQTDAIKRIVELYESTNRLHEAEAWRARLDSPGAESADDSRVP